MLPIEFQDHRNSGSGEDVKVFSIYVIGSHLDMLLGPFTRYMKSGFDLVERFCRRRSLKMVKDQRITETSPYPFNL